MKRLAACLIALTLLALGPNAFANESGTVSTGAKGDEVIRLQTRLAELGFLDAKIDGIYGKKTEAAVKAFRALLLERAGGDPKKASGKSISAEDLEVLYASPFSFYISDLKLGDEGSAVERLQSALIRLNCLDGEADGIFAEYTRDAVRLFQKLNGLPETGAADRATQDLLTNGGAAAERPAYKELKKGDKGSSVRAVQARLIELGLLSAPEDGFYGGDTVAAIERLRDHLTAVGDPFVVEDADVATIELQKKLDSDLPVFVEALSSGVKRAGEVKRLQRRLNALGYVSRRSFDGKYGSGTQAAVALFQANNGLPQTGEADAATQKLLYSDGAVGMLTEYRLNVSIEDQRVYVYKLAGKKYVKIDEFICSTGLGNATPRGVFTTTVPGRRWHYFKEFFIWAQYAYSIEGDILFHSVLYNSRGGSPTWSSVHNLGRKASHGCIRLKVEHAKWIYENCKRGTVVTIY